jgi:hypothetical protein
MKIKFPIAFAILAMFPCLAMAQSVAPPPQPLHQVGDHWTPYDPPADFPEGSQVHTIVKGDTLWDLASTYLGDPYLWPQLWERNPYIRDSHWIYPGDPLVIDLAVQEPEPIIEEVIPEEYVEPPEEVPEEVNGGSPHPLASAAEIYCFGKLIEDESIFLFNINSAERIQFQDHYSEGDIVYINGGVEQGVQAGDRFFILHPGEKVRHPVSNSLLGRSYPYTGQLKILCAQENTSIAEVTFACDFISLGDVLLPYHPIPVPLVVDPDASDRCDVPNGNATGYVIYSKDHVTESGIGQVVMIDLGNAEGLYAGQFATIFRDNPVEGMPRLVIGEIGLLTVEETYSTAIITRGWSPVLIGDRVELK